MPFNYDSIPVRGEPPMPKDAKKFVAGLPTFVNKMDLINLLQLEDDEFDLEEFAAKDVVENAIASAPDGNMVFSKSWCPYCKAAKDLLSSKGIRYNAMELD